MSPQKKTKEKVEDVDSRERGCPVGDLFGLLEDMVGGRSAFRKHMLGARKEVLLAVKSLLESRIEAIDKEVERSQQKKRKLTKIKVEEA